MQVTYVFLDYLCFYLFNPKVPPLIRGVIFLTQPIGITVNPYHSPSSSLVVAIRTSSSSWLIKYPYDQKMGVFVSSDFSHPDVDIISTHSTSTYITSEPWMQSSSTLQVLSTYLGVVSYTLHTYQPYLDR